MCFQFEKANQQKVESFYGQYFKGLKFTQNIPALLRFLKVKVNNVVCQKFIWKCLVL